MIEYIKGILTELSPTEAVIEAAGVGYGIAITLPTYSALIGKEVSGTNGDASLNGANDANDANGANGEMVKLYITEVIREDTHELYGFCEKKERQVFELLMTVSGVGASTARMIMSAFSAEELRMQIATGNAKGMAKVKGLGPKTAQRIIVDLKDKAIKLGAVTGEGLPVTDEGLQEMMNGVRGEAISALTMLGFQASASGKAVEKILKSEPALKVEEVIRKALKML